MFDVLAGAGDVTLSFFYRPDGTLSDPGTVTVDVHDGNGVAVATGAATGGSGAAARTYVLAASVTTTPRWLRLRWKRAGSPQPYHDQWVEVVGSTLFGEADARARLVAGQTPLADTTLYPDELIAGYRLLITDMFEQRTGRAPIRRYCRSVLGGNGSYGLNPTDGWAVAFDGSRFHRPGRGTHINEILGATVNGSAVSVGDLAVLEDTFWRTDGTWTANTWETPGNVVVEWVYGQDPTWEARENGLRVLAQQAVPRNVDWNATGMTTPEGTTIRYTPLPLPVEEWLRSVDLRVPLA